MWASNALSFGLGFGSGWLLSPTFASSPFVYSNPFVVQSATVPSAFDYSQPIFAPTTTVEGTTVTAPVDVPVTINVLPPATEPVPPAPVPTPVDPSAPPAPGPTAQKPDDRFDIDEDQQRKVIEIFDEARALFRKGDFAGAEKKVDESILLVPHDPTLHEFRGLTLFAQKRYQEAAAAIHSVLASGPGWDWETMRGFYPDVDTYTAQLRALEERAKAYPSQAYLQFLLGYHYITIGQVDLGIKQFETVAKLLPNDELTTRLLKILRTPPPADDRPQPGGTPTIEKGPMPTEKTNPPVPDKK